MQSYYPPPPPPSYGYPPRPAGPPRIVASSAVLSLVFGIMSLVCTGFLSGIPAIILGIVARKRIREGAGTVGGHGLAVAGLVTGTIGSILSLALTALIVLGALLGDAVPDPDGGPQPAIDVSAPAKSFTKLELRADGGTLVTQLKREAVLAKANGQRPIAILHAEWCMPCKELEREIDQSKGKGLQGARILMIDVDAFDDELVGAGLDGRAIPSLFHIDATGHGYGKAYVGANLDALRGLVTAE